MRNVVRFLCLLALAAAGIEPALAQGSPGLIPGQVVTDGYGRLTNVTAPAWNGYFATKENYSPTLFSLGNVTGAAGQFVYFSAPGVMAAGTFGAGLNFSGGVLTGGLTTATPPLAITSSVLSLNYGAEFTASGSPLALHITTGGVTNAMLANPGLTLGSTAMALGSTTSTIAGLTLSTPSITGTIGGAPVLTNATGLPLTTGVTGTLPIANGGTNATTADAAHGQLNTPRSSDVQATVQGSQSSGPLSVWDGNGNVVSITGSTTSGLQEAFNKALTASGTAGQDLSISGADEPSFGAYVVPMTTTLTIPASQGKKIRMGSLTIDPTSAIGSNTGMVFDSMEMTDFDCSGCQLTYAGTGIPIDFAPSTGTPGDHQTGVTDSRIHFTTSAPLAFTYPLTTSSFTSSSIDVGELNAANSANFTPEGAGFFVASPTSASQNWAAMDVHIGHLHGVPASKTGWQVGTAAPAGGSSFGDSFYKLHLSLGDGGVTNDTGIDTWESGSLYLATIDGVTTGTSVKLESGACSNILVIPHNSDWSTFTDSSGCTGSNSNIVIGNGTITQAGVPAVFANVGQIPGTATNDNATAGHVGEYISQSVNSGSAVSLTNNTAATVTSISLTAGDWDVGGTVAFQGGATTTVTLLIGQVGTATAITNDPGTDSRESYNSTTAFNSSYVTRTPTVQRISVASTTTVYLVAYASFGTSTASAFGKIWARRVR